MSTPTFTTTDVWLLLSIAYASSVQAPASLREVLGAGDTINHAIFSGHELRRGTAKLIAAGYLEYHDEGFLITSEGKMIVDRARGSAGADVTIREHRERLNSLLSAQRGTQADADFEDPAELYPSLTDAAVNSAYLEHKAEFERMIAKIIAGVAPAPRKPSFSGRLRAFFARFKK